jgi:D-3-phosphoglycerate dehydrogenase / 2-oxoglutarate reductase
LSKKFKVLLTNPIHPECNQALMEECDVVVAPDIKPETLKGLITDCDGLIVRCQLPQDIFDGAKQLKAVVRHGVGLDFIPVDVATKKRIPVANLPGSNTNAVVEYCLAAIFYFRRRLDLINSQLRIQGWAKARPVADPSTEIATTTLGIIGFGSIGGKLANAAMGLNMKTIALTRLVEFVQLQKQSYSRKQT